jgi:molybdopterin synthase sulfur carrier subunit
MSKVTRRLREALTAMSVLVRIPTPLRAITKGQGELRVEAADVREALERLDQEFAGIKGRLCEDDGSVRRFINVYVNEEDIRFMQGLTTPLKAGDEVSIVPAMAGGK